MSRRPISLHQLSMMELTAIELVRTASAAGFDRVCAYTCDPPRPNAGFPLITPDTANEMARVLEGEGVALYNVEVFVLTPDSDVAAFEAPLALGAKLGGTRATAVIGDEDEVRAAANLARFAELAGTFGIGAGVEFMAFSAIRTLGDAVRIVRGAAHPNVSVALDPLHLIRNGSTIADLRDVGSALIGYVQLCDGPVEMAEEQRWDEAIANRLMPGEGAFPLRELLALLPADHCVSLEVPMERRRLAGQDALTRARLLAAATRALEPVAT